MAQKLLAFLQFFFFKILLSSMIVLPSIRLLLIYTYDDLKKRTFVLPLKNNIFETIIWFFGICYLILLFMLLLCI